MFTPEFYYARVIANNSLLSPEAKKDGSVKFRIDPMMDGINDDTKLPWAKPFFLSTGGSSTYGNSSIPEINSLIWIFFADPVYNKKPYYIADVHLIDSNPHGLFESSIKSKITGFTSVYPDIKFMHFKNGINIAVSSSLTTPEICIYHPQGTYIFINSTGIVEIKAGVTTTQKMALGETLKTILENLIDGITSATFGGYPIDSPTALNAVKSSLSTILSPKIKNN